MRNVNKSWRGEDEFVGDEVRNEVDGIGAGHIYFTYQPPEKS
jgi:hypothetical protein